MKKTLLLTAIFILLGVYIHGQTDSGYSLREAYINKYWKIAVDKMRDYRIPASITLAQGILESGAGRSDLATEANNHFGIKCHKDWNGDSFIKDDDAKGECFRKYSTAEESFRDHSLFLTNRTWYAPLFQLDITDYKGWAKGLKSAGYATNPNYSQMLIKLIEDHKLYRFDDPSYLPESQGILANNDSTKSSSGEEIIEEITEEKLLVVQEDNKQEEPERLQVYDSGPVDRSIFLINGLRCLVAKPDDNILRLAIDFSIDPADLIRYNDLDSRGSIRPGQVIFLEKKKRTAQRESFTVASNESLYDISQLFGVRLSLLVKRNGGDPHSPLPTGTKISLNKSK